MGAPAQLGPGKAFDFLCIGVRLHRLFANGENRPQDRYYYDNRVLTGSPVLPPVGETH